MNPRSLPVGLILLIILTLPLGSGSALLSPGLSKLKAEVIKITDGDTLVVRLSGEERPVRLLGIDAPERGERLYGEAKQRLTELAGKRVFLESDGGKKDRYGRLLFWVFSEDGRLINAELVEAGLADPFFRPSFRGRRYAGEILRRALEAEQKKLGIWSDAYSLIAVLPPAPLVSFLRGGFLLR